MKKNYWPDNKEGHRNAALKGWKKRQVKDKIEIFNLTPVDKKWLASLRELVEIGEPGKRFPTKEDGYSGYGSSYPDWMKNNGWTKKEVLKVFDVLEGDRIFPKRNVRQLHIADVIKQEIEYWKRHERYLDKSGKKSKEEVKKSKTKVKPPPKEVWASDLKKGQVLDIKGEKFVVIHAGGKNKTTHLQDGNRVELAPFDTVKSKYLVNPKHKKKKISRDTLWYYGRSVKNPKRIVVFSSNQEVTRKTHGEKVVQAIGPFISKYDAEEHKKEFSEYGVKIYENIHSIEAKKGKNSLWAGENFKHDFKGKAAVYGQPDGSLLIKGNKRLWKRFSYKDNKNNGN